MRKNHSTGKLLGILATSISAGAIAFAAMAGVAHAATHPSAAPGPQQDAALAAAPGPQHGTAPGPQHGTALAATPNQWEE